MAATPKAPILYPGTKFKDMGKNEMSKKDIGLSSGKFKANVTGEGESGKAGGHMHPAQALEKGGKVVEQSDRRTGVITSEKTVAKKKGY